MGVNRFWVLINHALRTRPASSLFFLLLRSEIRRSTRAIKAVDPSIVAKPILVTGLSETKRRIYLGEGFVPVSRVRHTSNQRDLDAPQFLIDAILEGGDALESFLTRQESNPCKPYWTTEYSKQRLASTRALQQIDPQNFVIWVAPTDNGHFEVIDGNHRLRLAYIRGLIEIKVIFFLNSPSIDWANPRSFFLNRLIDLRKNHSGLVT
jgi:hypothetical protein